jgi:hypothetical protein
LGMRGPGGPAGLQNRFAAFSKAVAVRFPRIPLFEWSADQLVSKETG